MSLIELSFESQKEKECFAMVDFFYEKSAEGEEDLGPVLSRMLLFYALLRLHHVIGADGVEKVITKYKHKVSRVLL